MTNNIDQVNLMDAVEGFCNYWRSRNPTTSMLNGGVVDYRLLEDLTDEEFYSQIKNLREFGYRIETASIQHDSDNLLKKEALRSINLKLFTLEMRNPYQKSLSSYLKIITITIYLYHDLIKQSKDMKQFVLETILDWLKTAQNRSIFISRADINYLGYLVEYFNALPNHRGTYLSSNLIGEISKVCHFLSLKENTFVKGSENIEQLDFLYHECYGVEDNIYQLHELLLDTLYVEIECLEKNKERLNNTQSNKKISKDFLLYILDDLYQLEKDVNIPVFEKGKFKIETLPDYFSYFVNEGFYLHNNNEKKLLISNQITNLTFNRRNLAFLYTFLAHEIYPGHHNHMNAMNNDFIKGHIDCLYNPIGLEGWAIMSEQVVDKFNLKWYFNLFNLRRLVPVAIYLENLLYGEKRADILVSKIFNSSSILYSEYKKNKGFGSPNIIYTLGYLEYKRFLCDDKIYNRDFMSYGPLTPKYIAETIKHKNHPIE